MLHCAKYLDMTAVERRARIIWLQYQSERRHKKLLFGYHPLPPTVFSVQCTEEGKAWIKSSLKLFSDIVVAWKEQKIEQIVYLSAPVLISRCFFSLIFATGNCLPHIKMIHSNTWGLSTQIWRLYNTLQNSIIILFHPRHKKN